MSQVLIVDDETAITEGLVELFELENIPAAGAIDRESAEELIGSEFFPVILADLRLKTEADGLALLDSIRRLSPDSRVASLTAFASPEIEAELLRRGSSIVLRKPMEFDEIVAVVTEMLAEIESAAAEQEARTRHALDPVMLYEDVRKILYSIPQKRFGFTPDEAEELVQEAWCLFLEKRKSVLLPKAWLAGTMVNLCKQQIHSLTRGRELNEMLGRTIDRPYSQESRSTDAAIMVQQALDAIDERGRQLCVLIGMEGWSYDEVSDHLGIPIGSIGPLYIRAKSKLRKILSQNN